MNKKLTITIGIPIYNEEKNILKLLKSLLRQKIVQGELEKILVLSDGSTDATDKLVASVKDFRVELISDGKRKGKPVRINELFRTTTSDIVVILDGDIIITSQQVINSLITPFATKISEVVVLNSSL